MSDGQVERNSRSTSERVDLPSRARPARWYLRRPGGGAAEPTPQPAPRARAWARAETARRRRFPFPRGTPAGADAAGEPARAHTEAGCSGGGAGGAGLAAIPEPQWQLGRCGETESGRRPRLWPGRRRRRERGPEAWGPAVGPRNQVSARPAAEGATGARRSRTSLGPARRTCVPRGTVARAGPGRASWLQPRGVPRSRPPETGPAPGSWGSRALCFKSPVGPLPPAPGAGWTGTRESDGPSGGGETRSSGAAVAAGVWPPGPALTGKWFLAPAGPPRPPPAAPGLRSLCPDPGDPGPRRGERPRLTPGAFSSTATRASLWGPAPAGRPG